MTIHKMRGETITLATSRAFATVRGFPPGFNVLELEAPSSTVEAITVGFGPKIRYVYFYDDSAGTFTDVTSNLTNRNTGFSLGVGAEQTADRIYVGFARRAEGVSINVGTVNGAGTANSVWEYPAGFNAWTDLSATDGTDSTRTFDQDGLVTWTVPTFGWDARTLAEATNERVAAPNTDKAFWVRQRPSAALTTDPITLLEFTGLMNNVLNATTGNVEGQDLIRITSSNGGKPPYRFPLDTQLYGGVELASASITSAAHLNWVLET